MKKLWILFVLMFSAKLACANIDSHYAIINDKDGYVNIRQQNSLSAPIIAKLNNGVPVGVNCTDDYVIENKNFCFVNFGKDGSGFVYKNRLSFLAPNKDFIKIPLVYIAANKTEGIFADKDIVIKVKFKQAHIDINEFNEQTSSKFGINPSDPVADYYKMQNIYININNKTITLPSVATKDVYAHHIFCAMMKLPNIWQFIKVEKISTFILLASLLMAHSCILLSGRLRVVSTSKEVFSLKRYSAITQTQEQELKATQTIILKSL